MDCELLKNLLVELILELINLKARRGTAVVIAVTRVVHWGIECGRAAPTSASCCFRRSRFVGRQFSVDALELECHVSFIVL